MDIRVNHKYLKIVRAALDSADKSINRSEISISEDDLVESAVILISDKGRLDIPWFPNMGLGGILGFLKTGYMNASEGKICPYGIIRRKCIGKKCANYLIQNNIGDCAHVWAGVWK